LGLRRIAQAGIGTALETHLDLAAGTGGNLQFQALAIHLLFTEELVAVSFALRQRWMLFSRQAIEFQALLVQVIAIGNLPEQLGFTGFQAFRVKEALPTGRKSGLVSNGLVPAWARPESKRKK
jgi:hypothetical protein